MSWNVYVFNGQVSSGVVLENDGRMYVSSGGTAIDTTVSSHCQVNVERGGFADLTTVSSGGWMTVWTNGNADRPILSGGSLNIYAGGTATNIEWAPFDGMLSVSIGAHVTFASKCTGAYYGEGNVLVSQADVIEDKNLYGWYNDIYVMSGGLAKNTTVGSGAAVWIYDGGTASSTVINAHTTAYIFSGGSADDLKANGYGTVIVHSGGTATNLSLAYHYELCIAPGTYIQGTCGENAFEIADGVMSGGTMGSYGEIHVSSGGIADNVTLNFGSEYSDFYVEMNVHSGGIASNTTLQRESYLIVSSGGWADSTSIESGGDLVVYNGGTADHNTVHSRGDLKVFGGAANNTTVESGGFLCIESGGGAASNTTVESDGYYYLSSGGRHTGRLTMAEGAIVSAYSGSILDFSLAGVSAGADALVNDLAIIQGTPTYWFTINDSQENGVYKLAGGAAGFDETITVRSTSGESLGYFSVGDLRKFEGIYYSLSLNDGNVLTLTVGGNYVDTEVILTDGMSSGGLVIVNGGRLIIEDGAKADLTTVISDGECIVSSGGSAIDTTLLLSGRCIVYGVASNTVNSGGKLRISSGGVASKTTVVSSNGLYVYDDGTANETTVYSGAGLYVHGGVASNSTVHSYGELYIHSGGTAVGVTANASGAIGVEGVASNLIVNSGGGVGATGTVRNVTISSGGMLHFGAGGKLTGKMTFENGAVVSSFENSFVDFDLTRTSIGAEALLNNLSAIAGEIPLYTLTVGGSEAYGEYKLAEGAADFNETITVVNTSGTKLGTLTVGKKAMAGGAAYTLNLTDGSLSVTVEEPENGPEEPLNNYLYDKKLDPVINTNVTEEYGTVLTAAGQEIRLDKIGTVDYGEEHYHNHVGKSAEQSDADYTFDYAKIVLEHGAKLSFHAEATAAATFTVYSLTEKNGKYTLKKLQTLKLADKDKDGVFTADSSKPIQLQVSGDYYVSMQFKDKKAAEAYYNVTLNDASEFYPLGNNTDDWGDMKTAGWAGAVGDLGVINAASLEADKTVIGGEWIGFGDKVDCKKFTLTSAAELSLKVNAPDGPLKLTVCKLKETTSKKGVTTYSQTNVKSVTVSAKQGTASLSSLQLEAGEYFFRVDSSDVKKSTGYSVQVTDSTFYTDGDNGWNNWLYDKKDNAVNELMGSYVGTYSETWIDFDYDVYHDDYYNFVGFGDACDYSEIYVDEDGLYNFKIDTTGKAKFTVYSLTRNSKGKWTQKILGSQTVNDVNGATGVTLKKDVKLSATNDDLRYFVSMQAADTKKSPEVYYNVMSFPTAVSEADSLAMPESDSLVISDVLADVSAFDNLAELDGKSEWHSLLA